MFVIDSSFVHVAAPPNQILALWQAINALTVKIPGMPLEPTTSYIVLWSEGETNHAVCYLHYTTLHRHVAYVQSPPGYAITELEAVLDEAREFLESMGFMMDDADFARQPADRQVALMARTPAFHTDLQAFHRGRSDEVDEVGAAAEPELVLDEVVTPPAAAQIPAVATPSPERTAKVGRVLMSF